MNVNVRVSAICLLSVYKIAAAIARSQRIDGKYFV